ncbi:MAG: HAMP domain-containing protein [Candidatus Azotimanducaceae bacterium]
MTLVLVVLLTSMAFAIFAFKTSAELGLEVSAQQIAKNSGIEVFYGDWESGSALLEVALALSAFAIISGILISYHLTRRIHKLVDLVKRVQEGELTARADVRGDDEIAYLADNLNDLVRHLENENIRSKDV